MNYEDKLKEIQKNGKAFREVLSAEMKGFGEMHDAALEDKALDPKTKEFIALGISVAIRCEPCIIAHTSALIKMGATREEIAETLGVVFFMAGGPGSAYGATALACYDELVEKLK